MRRPRRFDWVSSVERIGIASAVTGALLWGGYRIAMVSINNQRCHQEKQEELTKTLIDATIDDSKERTKQGHEMTSAMSEVKATMVDLRGLNRKAREADSELLATNKQILAELRSQNRMPAPKAGKSQ